MGDVTLRCWDTGGSGEAVVLLHPAVGHGDMFTHLQASLAGAGYRAISYSRRGHRGSARIDPARPGTATGDLIAVANELGLDQFHLLGTALGGFTAVDAALAAPERVSSLTVSSSLCGIQDPAFVATTRRLVPPAWHGLPAELRELGPAYRAAHPEGVKLWTDLTADCSPDQSQSTSDRTITFAALRTLAVPTLFVTGDADPYVPPPRMREICASVDRARLHIVPECGHSPYWEQPELFDRLVVGFLLQ